MLGSIDCGGRFLLRLHSSRGFEFFTWEGGIGMGRVGLCLGPLVSALLGLPIIPCAYCAEFDI